MILSEAETRDLTHKVLGFSKAESSTVTISGFEQRHLRYAQNMATTSGAPSGISISVESHFGKRSGSASGTDLDDKALKALVAASEETAQRAPANPEFMPPLGPQKYVTGSSFFPSTNTTSSAMMAQALQPTLQQAEAKNILASGFLQIGTDFTSFGTSKGLFVHDTGTGVLNTITARTTDGTGSGWAGTTMADFGVLDATGMGGVAIDKAIRSQKPTTLPPGDYMVILEPSAIADLVTIMMGYFDARAADEGRSFATKKGGGSREGEKLFGDNVTIASDPNDTVVPGAIFSDDGLPAPKGAWVENGILKNLPCSRYWAQHSHRAAQPGPTSLKMLGGTTSTADMIKQVKRGLLITRLWYIREVDPQTVLLTGLTRDGVFLIENGTITRPVCNFRFNESPVAMLNKVLALGPSVRAYGSEIDDGIISVPTLLVDKFKLSSVSLAV